MNAEQFLEVYDRVKDAPDAADRMRRFVLDLAVGGKLVEQNQLDNPDPELLEDGRVEECKQNKAWLVSDTGVLLEFKYGKGKKISECLENGPVPVYGSNGIVGYCETALFNSRSIIVGRKGSAGAINKSCGPAWVTDVAYYIFTPSYFDEDYLYWSLKGLRLEKLAKGVKPGLSRSDAYKLPLSVPPLAEQHRIVAKVDELMALCDQIEKARKRRESTREKLTVSCMRRLTEADSSAEEFRSHAGFVIDNFKSLAVNADQIRHLRQTILDLAVRGRLVEQDPDDEPASELLKRIAVKKQEMVDHGEIRKFKVLPPVDKSPYLLPETWCWTRVREIFTDRGQKVPDSKFTYIDVTAIDKELGRIVTPKILSSRNAPSRARKIAQRGDVIYSCVRPYLLNIAVLDKDFNPSPIVSTAFAVLNGHDLVVSRYAWIVLRSSFFVELVQAHQRGQAYPAINDSDFALLTFPLPPLAEQRRIVKKVDGLRGLCDQIEEASARKEDAQERLALLTHSLVSLEDS